MKLCAVAPPLVVIAPTGSSYSLTNTGSISAILGGTGVALTKTGAGTVTISGANTYTGGTNISAGQLYINSRNNALGSGTIVLGTTAGTADASLFLYQSLVNNDITVASGTGARTIQFDEGGIFAQTTGSNISLSNNLDVVNQANGGGKTFVLSGTLTGTGNMTFTNTSAGETRQSNTINNTGTLTHDGGGFFSVKVLE